MTASKLHIHPANGKQRPAALTNKKQDNSDQIHADNTVKRMGFSITARSMKMFIFWTGAEEKLQSMIQPLFMLIFSHACQPSSNPSRDPVPLLRMAYLLSVKQTFAFV
jgi:hypothetical protein